MRRLVLLAIVVVGLASLPIVFGFSRSRCRPIGDRPSLLVGLHPGVQGLRDIAHSYMNAPSAFQRFETAAAPFDSPEGVLEVACSQGYRYAAWIGPGDGGMTGILHGLPSGDEVLARMGERSAGGMGGIESVAGELLLDVFLTGEGWKGLEYFVGAPPQAIRDFIQGEALFRRSYFRQATPFFESLVDEDSTSAYAYYRLANARAWDTGQGAGQEAISRAVELAEGLTPEDSVMVVGVGEHYHLRYGYREPFTEIDTLSAEAMLQRGDAIFHLGPMRRVRSEAAEPYFLAAQSLDPGLTPAWLHLIDLAIMERDSALAYARFREFSRLADGSVPYLRAKYALDLVFGSLGTRTRAIAAIDTARAGLPFSVPYLAQEFLGRPDLLDYQEMLLRLDRRVGTVEPSPENRVLRGGTRLLVYNYLFQGRVKDAARVIGLLGPEDRPFRKLIHYSTDLWGVQWPAGGDEFAWENVDPGNPIDLFYSAAHYLDAGPVERFQAARRELERHARTDPDVALWVRALDARRLWQDGDGEAGLESLLAVATDPAVEEIYATHETMRWWLGAMNLALGRSAEAASWFRSIRNNPYAICNAFLAERSPAAPGQLPGPDREARSACLESLREGRPIRMNPAQ